MGVLREMGKIALKFFERIIRGTTLTICCVLMYPLMEAESYTEKEETKFLATLILEMVLGIPLIFVIFCGINLIGENNRLELLANLIFSVAILRVLLFGLGILYFEAKKKTESQTGSQGLNKKRPSSGIWEPIDIPTRKDGRPSLTKPWEQIATNKTPQ